MPSLRPGTDHAPLVLKEPGGSPVPAPRVVYLTVVHVLLAM